MDSGFESQAAQNGNSAKNGEEPFLFLHGGGTMTRYAPHITLIVASHPIHMIKIHHGIHNFLTMLSVGVVTEG